MQIDPKVAMIVKIVLGLLTAVTNGTLVLTGILSPEAATKVVAICASLISVIGIFMSAFSSSAPGPLAPPDAPSVVAAEAAVTAKTAQAVADHTASIAAAHAAAPPAVPPVVALALMALIIGALALFDGGMTTAHADPLTFGLHGGKLSATPTTDATGAAATSPVTVGPLHELSDIFASDFAGASTLSVETSIKDGNGQACWAAFKPFGELLKAHREAFTGKLATDLEAQRLAVIMARQLCDNTACQTVFTEQAAGIQTLLQAVPVSVGVNFTPVNVFAQACAHVPNVALVAPAPVSTPAPTGN